VKSNRKILLKKKMAKIENTPKIKSLKKTLEEKKQKKAVIEKVELKPLKKPKKYTKKDPLIIPEKKYPIEYKRLGLLKNFVTKYGKIRSRRVSKLILRQQRKISRAIRRARCVGLIPCLMIAKSYRPKYVKIPKKRQFYR
jgi:small subunit ribosomal protein S18